MHVGLVVYGGLEKTSGGFRYDRRLVSALRDRGDTVDVIAIPWRRYSRGLLDGLSRSIRSRLDRSVDVLVQDELCHPSLWWHNRRLTRPDAVVALVHHLRSDDPTERFASLYRPVERRYLESVDATITTSEFTRTRASRLTPAVASKPNLVATPGGRVESPAVSPDRVTDRADEGPLRIAFVGNLVPRKDPKTLLSAVARAGRNWDVTVVGSHDAEPDYATAVRKYATERGLEDRVTFTGEVDDSTLVAVLADSHVCCVPSRYEAFGMVYLEAMEYGVVPVASAVGGAREFVDHGHDGFLLTPGNDERLASLLAILDDDRDRLVELGRNALETAERYPGWEETMGKVRAFLRSQSASLNGQ
ncbi:glycosyltransferase family 4 protein [Natronobacterium texcoconense]|uniref:Glycosyltransferase involved in cell wall bisynthesis n=1 Tax=Natronobacterium texcoconense TaxID=1095778 RepID=A0A1H1BT28_NATTX|nr:glycosyltransferase family 4 protein [Natronobacterium texcoconense]SDQ55095.1 Glycosyltransferase involved in cell wall bisynthesis [Natronobacterium texcoconense]